LQVILLQDVDSLGLRGDVVEVARGYARNFLLPRRLAESATPGRLADLERRDSFRARHEAKTFDEARGLADKLAGTEVRFDVKAGPTGALFGSVTPTNIADELWRTKKIRVDRRKIELGEPIKRVGRYEVPIELFADVRVELRTLVVPEGGELPPESEDAAEDIPVAESDETAPAEPDIPPAESDETAPAEPAMPVAEAEETASAEPDEPPET
jgi:large subunit ribosomal protein L9